MVRDRAHGFKGRLRQSLLADDGDEARRGRGWLPRGRRRLNDERSDIVQWLVFNLNWLLFETCPNRCGRRCDRMRLLMPWQPGGGLPGGRLCTLEWRGDRLIAQDRLAGSLNWTSRPGLAREGLRSARRVRCARGNARRSARGSAQLRLLLDGSLDAGALQQLARVWRQSCPRREERPQDGLDRPRSSGCPLREA
ncbi:MAG TPA: hypothetical protein VH083_23275 [Myxococcales bacterium]|nr:hypothetical protein [Myxococcales bacterium]